MSVDIFDNDDGVINQNSDRKDQGEQADPIEGVTEEVGGRQGQGQGDGDNDRDNCSFPSGPYCST